ncbi:Acg family FMN-binding oxidoreductase [Mycolicibacterium litorale]|uniref:NAD(P)H nitroreductase n=1 Tax=Mycolicibacterium litorale TaxID=758802 RepID=A0AAD1IMW0_9MYCO|nr:nitroreductase family protein [Mycolicibacterium litorale]MCV7418676.1 nitroreductase family protein [Mycolicibacterium litorale]TDY05926.1 nitroreductase family protein [Mycolicibacterium litorale]BBY14568.1 NAD(P)H nitroreductase [Mycolicibacterium litorale]
MSDTVVATEVIRDAVRLACRAPSLHNSQPWRWVADADGLHLFLDPARLMYWADRSGREAVISCGAVLDHLRVALAAAGWEAHVERLPDREDPDHLATVTVTPMESVSEAHRRRADAILLRRTDRLPMAAAPDWESFEPLMRARVEDDVHADILADQLRGELAETSHLTEVLRLYDSSYHAELSWWTAPFDAGEGIPQSALVSAAESERVDVGRNFPVTRGAERRPGIGGDRATIVVLSTDGDDRLDALRSGEAMSAVLLEATMAGLGTCTVTHVTEVASSRGIVGNLIGRAARPQVLIRVGLAPSLEAVPPPTPRRALRDVLRFA